ncbi:MAG: hypothetical protein KDE27_28145 [Planctomycetes bacterium]|nr:hypothetical protein [Planctomycetota bacterium]
MSPFGIHIGGFGGGPIDLWSHTNNCTELARGATYGALGWDFGEEYFFRVIYTPGSVDIWCNGSHEFSLAGTFTTGRFACYNFSQHHTGFQFPVVGSISQFGTACSGSYGVPYFFCPGSPFVGETLPFITANLNPTAVPFVILGVSNQSYLGNTLPASLSSYGAPGCDLLVSADLLLPATNYNGTGYTTFQLPLGLPPSATPLLYAQGMVLDPVANQLGIVLAEGVAIAPGIR